MKRRLVAYLLAAGLSVAANAYAQTPPPAAPSPTEEGEDSAFAAYQRGYFLTAFREASKLAERSDPKAMALLGELYSNGFGVGRDDAKAAQWYARAAAAGDAEAAFSLAVFKFQGRGGPRDVAAAVKLFETAANQGHVAAAYNLGIITLKGEDVPADPAKAAALIDRAAKAGMSEAQYVLATLYKDGRGVPKDGREAMRLMNLSARSGNIEAMVEFAIAQFNGTDTTKNETEAANLFLQAARRGNAIAQNRLARILSAGRGLPLDAVAAARWHLIAKAGGISDPDLDVFVANMKPSDRDSAEASAKKWLEIGPLRP